MLKVDIHRVDGRKVWHMFAPHHYLTEKYNGHRAFIATLPDGEVVGFMSSIAFPHPVHKGAYREHRTVVLPDYQGLGLGVRLSDWLAEWHFRQGQPYFSRTAHERMILYRQSSPLWVATRPRAARGEKSLNPSAKWKFDTVRVAQSFKYVGSQS